jgi:hypothetical protein
LGLVVGIGLRLTRPPVGSDDAVGEAMEGTGDSASGDESRRGRHQDAVASLAA